MARTPENVVELLESLVILGIVLDKENVKARLQGLASSIKDDRFDADDCFELKEIILYAAEVAIEELDDTDFNRLVNSCLMEVGSRSRVRESDRGSKDKTSKYRGAVSSFIKFLNNNSYGKIADFDRFKPIYEKFVQINEDVDNIVKDDITGFFKVFQEMNNR